MTSATSVVDPMYISLHHQNANEAKGNSTWQFDFDCPLRNVRHVEAVGMEIDTDTMKVGGSLLFSEGNGPSVAVFRAVIPTSTYTEEALVRAVQAAMMCALPMYPSRLSSDPSSCPANRYECTLLRDSHRLVLRSSGHVPFTLHLADKEVVVHRIERLGPCSVLLHCASAVDVFRGAVLDFYAEGQNPSRGHVTGFLGDTTMTVDLDGVEEVVDDDDDDPDGGVGKPRAWKTSCEWRVFPVSRECAGIRGALGILHGGHGTRVGLHSISSPSVECEVEEHSEFHLLHVVTCSPHGCEKGSTISWGGKALESTFLSGGMGVVHEVVSDTHLMVRVSVRRLTLFGSEVFTASGRVFDVLQAGDTVWGTKRVTVRLLLVPRTPSTSGSEVISRGPCAEWSGGGGVLERDVPSNDGDGEEDEEEEWWTATLCYPVGRLVFSSVHSSCDAWVRSVTTTSVPNCLIGDSPMRTLRLHNVVYVRLWLGPNEVGTMVVPMPSRGSRCDLQVFARGQLSSSSSSCRLACGDGRLVGEKKIVPPLERVYRVTVQILGEDGHPLHPQGWGLLLRFLLGQGRRFHTTPSR